MKALIYYALLAMTLAGPLLSGCKKDEPAAPITGGLNGTINPAGSITQVTAQGSNGRSLSATPDPITGAFNFNDLTAGQYTLNFTMASGYNPLGTLTPTIVAGQNTGIGTVQAISDGSIKSGTMSWTTGGTTYTATRVEGTINRQSRTFYVKGITTSGGQMDEVSIRRSIDSGFAGVGIYTLSFAEYRRTMAGALTVYADRTTKSPLVITQYDEAAGTIGGTFSFMAMTGDLGGNSIVVTDGTFSVKF